MLHSGEVLCLMYACRCSEDQWKSHGCIQRQLTPLRHNLVYIVWHFSPRRSFVSKCSVFSCGLYKYPRFHNVNRIFRMLQYQREARGQSQHKTRNACSCIRTPPPTRLCPIFGRITILCLLHKKGLVLQRGHAFAR